jgi:glycosyltransferase involved in cell wall biosynthesis
MKMNIAFLQRSFFKNTIEATKFTTLNLSKELVKNKNRVEIITEGGYSFEKKLDKHEIIEGISVNRPYFFPFPIKRNLRLIYMLNYFLAQSLGVRYVQNKLKMKFDIIHSLSSAPVLVLTGVFAKLFSKKAKLVHTIKSESLHGYKFTRLLNLADKVIVPLKHIKNELVERGCKNSKITIIRSSIDTSKFKLLNKAKLKEKHGFKNKKVILYFGGFTENKGVDYLIQAIPYVVDKEPNVEILFVNRGECASVEDKYKKMLESLGKYRKNVKMFFKILDVPEYLNAVDILVLPYANLKATEANPSCLLEGIACKTPIVTSDLPELREILEPNKDVLMARPKDSKNIAENILKLLNDKELQKKLTENAYKKIKQFDIKHITQQHIDLYNSLLKK